MDKELKLLDMLLRYVIHTSSLAQNMQLGGTDWKSLRTRAIKAIEESTGRELPSLDHICQLHQEIYDILLEDDQEKEGE